MTFSAPAVDEKGDVFCLFVCLFVTLWNYEVCDNGNAMKQYYYQNNYCVSACRKVCSCASRYSTFSVDPEIFPQGQIYANFTRFLRL